MLATSAGATPTPAVAQTVLVALEQCCKSRSTSLLIIALDCLAKLTSYGFFAEATRSANGGHVRVPHAAVTADDLPASGTVERTPSGTLQGVVDAELDSGQASSTAAATGSANGSATSDAVTYEDVGFMEQVVDIIYHSFSGEATEEKVQLQIFKVGRKCAQ